MNELKTKDVPTTRKWKSNIGIENQGHIPGAETEKPNEEKEAR